jgi:RNA polymerase sigma-70 factor (ECF subfamily)
LAEERRAQFARRRCHPIEVLAVARCQHVDVVGDPLRTVEPSRRAAEQQVVDSMPSDDLEGPLRIDGAVIVRRRPSVMCRTRCHPDGRAAATRTVMVAGSEVDAEVYAQHAVALVRFATGLVGPNDAADVVAEAVMRVMASPVWHDARNRRALLYQAVVFEAKAWRRTETRRRAREARSVPNGGEVVDAPEFAPEVREAVEALSQQQRAVVFLTYWEDLEPAASAELLGVSEGTVRKQLARARKRLRRVL